ncbi:hypothetical protein BDW69DRAFT_105351 [Aspergillus filifer]
MNACTRNIQIIDRPFLTTALYQSFSRPFFNTIVSICLHLLCARLRPRVEVRAISRRGRLSLAIWSIILDLFCLLYFCFVLDVRIGAGGIFLAFTANDRTYSNHILGCCWLTIQLQ